MEHVDLPKIEFALEQLFLTRGEALWDQSIPELIALVDRKLSQSQALSILTGCWAQLSAEMDDQPSADEMLAWRVLLHARQHLENEQ